MTKTQSIRRIAAGLPAAALVLALSACGPDNADPAAGPSALGATAGPAIPRCDTRSLVTLADGQSVKLCAVYLVPNETPPGFLTYGNIMDTAPLVWKVG
ncbi:hypothetical protein [Kitasatospora sp. NPDC098663]|uniref:hypothetical protein n=1 Tax=Kitasatospora sp. NPDC098663 TaxID=3364096 RepID=UPI0038007869